MGLINILIHPERFFVFGMKEFSAYNDVTCSRRHGVDWIGIGLISYKAILMGNVQMFSRIICTIVEIVQYN